MCQRLHSNLQSCGRRTNRSLLAILDGSKALGKAVPEMFGDVALVQRCQIPTLRNIMDYPADRQRPWVKAIRFRRLALAVVGRRRGGVSE